MVLRVPLTWPGGAVVIGSAARTLVPVGSVAEILKVATQLLGAFPHGGQPDSRSGRMPDPGLDGLTPHDLRHTAISLWILAGTDVKTVSVRAGHSSTSFTLYRYGHLYEGADAQSIARLDALIGDASPAPTADVRPFRR